MSIQKKCPSCNEHVVFTRIQRTFFEKNFNKREYYKYKCINCSAEILSHCAHHDVKLCRHGELIDD